MEGYKINIGQKTAIVNTSFAMGQYFNPVQDINGNWFIFEIEMQALVINNAFKNATKEEYVPPTPTEII